MIRSRNATIENMASTPEKYTLTALAKGISSLRHTWRAVHVDGKPSRTKDADDAHVTNDVDEMDEGPVGRDIGGGPSVSARKHPILQTEEPLTRNTRQRVLDWRTTVAGSDFEPEYL
ncbi:hypothetical protein BV25DRAFT_920751 [Artomyces pyxidatus]|uniref:Uncharacterized protein n=1 Tax=Artomyces pyxidatus TaxID=48021 RepID=A0ACB8SWD1_9AGAM|nr:hypothetical protein BV25DRAFT_920751 [Artomyces pyxidatus]